MRTHRNPLPNETGKGHGAQKGQTSHRHHPGLPDVNGIGCHTERHATGRQQGNFDELVTKVGHESEGGRTQQQGRRRDGSYILPDTAIHVIDRRIRRFVGEPGGHDEAEMRQKGGREEDIVTAFALRKTLTAAAAFACGNGAVGGGYGAVVLLVGRIGRAREIFFCRNDKREKRTFTLVFGIVAIPSFIDKIFGSVGS
jgi:hypothetical protein